MPPGQPSPASTAGWSWDPTLYAGSARHYAVGRVDYPGGVAGALRDALGLDGTGVLVDVGCGPGSLTLLLAPLFARAVGVDADPDMLVEAARLADDRKVLNVEWHHLRAEELPADLPAARVITFAQSFHWMDRTRVAAAARALLAPGGAVVHVHANTHQGLAADEDGDERGDLAHPPAPHEDVSRLVTEFLGPVRRAGQGVLTAGTAEGEDEVYRAAGLAGPQRLSVPGRVVERTVDQVAASVYSLSSAAPHLFGDRLDAFDARLRKLLASTADDGRFSERMRSVELDVWR